MSAPDPCHHTADAPWGQPARCASSATHSPRECLHVSMAVRTLVKVLVRLLRRQGKAAGLGPYRLGRPKHVVEREGCMVLSHDLSGSHVEKKSEKKSLRCGTGLLAPNYHARSKCVTRECRLFLHRKLSAKLRRPPRPQLRARKLDRRRTASRPAAPRARALRRARA